MKKDIEWLKKEIEEYLEYEGVRDARIALESVLGYIDQLDEPEQTDINVGLLKPVIPQFVADYIEKWKYEGLIMHEWFTFDHDDEDEDKVYKWLYDNDHEESMKREHLLIDGLRYGYEVEKEKRYRVVLPFTVWDGHASEMKESTMLLALDITSGETRFPHSAANIGDYRTDLTESQIKGIDKRYWAFAEEVTE